MLACSKGDAEVVKLLLEQEQIDINAKTANGWTALMSACRNGSINVVQLLLDHKDIDINAKTDDGKTALAYACQGCYIDVIKLLIKQENIVYDYASTLTDNPEIIQLLRLKKFMSSK